MCNRIRQHVSYTSKASLVAQSCVVQRRYDEQPFFEHTDLVTLTFFCFVFLFINKESSLGSLYGDDTPAGQLPGSQVCQLECDFDVGTLFFHHEAPSGNDTLRVEVITNQPR